MTRTEFLLARIAEDAAAANLAKWPYGKDHTEAPPWPSAEAWSRQLSTDEGPLIGTMSPDRVLAECEAKRRIVEAARHALFPDPLRQGDYWRGARETAEADLCFLAQPYTDHPDFDPEWKP